MTANRRVQGTTASISSRNFSRRVCLGFFTKSAQSCLTPFPERLGRRRAGLLQGRILRVEPVATEHQAKVRRVVQREADVGLPDRQQPLCRVGTGGLGAFAHALRQTLEADGGKRRQQALDIPEVMSRCAVRHAGAARALAQRKRLEPGLEQQDLGSVEQGATQVTMVVGVSRDLDFGQRTGTSTAHVTIVC